MRLLVFGGAYRSDATPRYSLLGTGFAKLGAVKVKPVLTIAYHSLCRVWAYLSRRVNAEHSHVESSAAGKHNLFCGNYACDIPPAATGT